ncbi:MAG: DUF2127 domain-containing protein [Thermoproteota archaeon]|nr:DUF2127 domain-containing protein [Thermoproteota archaeon]
MTAAAISPLLSNVHISSSNTTPSGTTITTTTVPHGLVKLSAGIGAGLVAIGVAYLVMAYGLWRGKRWAWTITVILSFIGIALGAASIVTGNIAAIFHLIINAIVIYYLYRPHVKVFFGKMGAAATV